MSILSGERSSDLEAQKINLLYDLKSDDTRITAGELFEKPNSTIALPDGAIKSIHKSGQTSFLIWTTINTLATIGIVENPFHNFWTKKENVHSSIVTANQKVVSGLYK